RDDHSRRAGESQQRVAQVSSCAAHQDGPHAGRAAAMARVPRDRGAPRVRHAGPVLLDLPSAQPLRAHEHGVRDFVCAASDDLRSARNDRLCDSLRAVPSAARRLGGDAWARGRAAQRTKRVISVVLPAFNEQENIPQLYERLTACARTWNEDYEIIVVNDGSRDGTLAMCASYVATDPRFKVLSFSRNFGHPAAITAGLRFSSGDIVAILDS